MLGVITAVEIDLLPVSEFYGRALLFDGSHAAEALGEWRRWTADLPATVNASVCIQQRRRCRAFPSSWRVG